MKVAAIIQARMSSNRLPGKVMENIVGKPMLCHIVERLNKAKLLDNIIVATTDKEIDEPLIKLTTKRRSKAPTKIGSDLPKPLRLGTSYSPYSAYCL